MEMIYVCNHYVPVYVAHVHVHFASKHLCGVSDVSIKTLMFSSLYPQQFHQ